MEKKVERLTRHVDGWFRGTGTYPGTLECSDNERRRICYATTTTTTTTTLDDGDDKNDGKLQRPRAFLLFATPRKNLAFYGATGVCPAELAADSRRGRMQGQRDEKTSGRSGGGSPLAGERQTRGEGKKKERERATTNRREKERAISRGNEGNEDG